MLDARVQLAAIDPVLAKSAKTPGELVGAVERQGAQIRELAMRHGIDGIYERYSLFCNGGVEAADALGLPHVLEVNAPLREEARRFRTLPYPEEAAEIEREVFARSSRILVVSRTLAAILDAEGWNAKVDVVPNAVDPDEFAGERRPHAEFTVGFAGSLKPWHGVEVLLEAFGLALAEVPTLRLEIVGDGPRREAVERSPHRGGALRYLGHLPHAETIRAMAGWDVGAAPFLPMPRFYFSPLKLVEYMAAGACPVASDNPELRSLLGGGERGVLVPAASAEALARALVELAREPARATAIGARGRAYALGSLSWLETARGVLATLRSEFKEQVA
jgi:glycosyltransferase involved in cell wall biosynthesis